MIKTWLTPSKWNIQNPTSETKLLTHAWVMQNYSLEIGAADILPRVQQQKVGIFKFTRCPLVAPKQFHVGTPSEKQINVMCGSSVMKFNSHRAQHPQLA
jgi:hypothetical protein